MRLRLGAVAVIAALGVSACGKSVSNSNNGSPPSTSGQTTSPGGATQTTAAVGHSIVPPAKGSISQVTWNLQFGEPTSLDWLHAFDYSENTVVANMCENLLRLTPDFKIVPGLASSYQALPKAAPTRYVMNLRHGVTFWDGHPMTAQDVVYSMDRNLDPKVGSYWSATYQYVKSIKQTGPMQVTISMKRPDALFSEFLALPTAGVGEKAYIQSKGSSYGTPDGGVMCTGPFQFVKWNKGDSIILKRNPNYWDKSLEPKVDTLKFTFLSDDASAVSALVSGGVDGEYDVPLSGLTQLKNSTVGKFYSGAGLQTLDIGITSLSGPLKSVLIRRALEDVIDYQGIVKTVLQGTGEPIKTLVTPATYGYAKSIFDKGLAKLPQPTQDLAKAKALIKQAGGAPSKPIVIAYRPSNQLYTQVLDSVQSSAAQVGLKVQLRGIPDSDYADLFDDAKARQGLDGLVTLNYTDVPDPLEFYTQIAIPSVPENFDGFHDTKVINALSAARASGNIDKRAQLTSQAEQAIAKDVVWVPIVGVNTRLFMNNKITGAPSTFVYLYYPWAAQLGTP
jgi:peptide/nickel transport system substrate-binding protein